MDGFAEGGADQSGLLCVQTPIPQANTSVDKLEMEADRDHGHGQVREEVLDNERRASIRTDLLSSMHKSLKVELASKKGHAGCPSGVLRCVACSKKKRPCGAACASWPWS